MKIIQCLIGKKVKKHDPAVRSFAITLQSYSTRGYESLREKFNNTLSHVSTLRKWYANAQTGGESGITPEAITHLANTVSENKDNGKQLLVSLSLDEMAIRHHVQWSDSRKKFLGFIDVGKSNENGNLPIASNALVFMINGLNETFSLPLAYFFVTNLDAHEEMELLSRVIEAVYKTGAILINITFDGLKSNLKMCKLLGASFRVKNVKL